MKRVSPLVLKRILPLLIVTIALVTTSSFATFSSGRIPQTSHSGATLFASSNATATGTLSVQWGDPYLPALMKQGTGNVTMSVVGVVTSRPDLPGAYTYTQPTTTGELEAEWSTSNASYTVDVYFYQGESPYNRTTTFPSANTFAAMYIYCKGEITVNGVTSQVEGYAGLIATAPGFFDFSGTARATYVVLYSETFHGNQYVFRWSQTDQMIFGVEQPRSESLVTSVSLRQTG